MKKHDVGILISVGILCIFLLGNILVMLEGRKERIKIIRKEIEIEPEACSLNEMTLGQVYEVMGVEHYLSDVSRWNEGKVIELQFRAQE